MERLTKYTSSGNAVMTATTYREKATKEAIQKLAAYEDTRLSLERVAKLAEAERDERLIELPHKIGTTIYHINEDFNYCYGCVYMGEEGCIENDENRECEPLRGPVIVQEVYSFNFYEECLFVPVQIYLTHSEAEAALERMKNNVE